MEKDPEKPEKFNVHPGNSVTRLLSQGRPKMLFITERDTLFPPEEVPDPNEDEEEAKKRKKAAEAKKKKEEEEPKTYLHHKYQFPACGKEKRHLDNIAAQSASEHFTLSCFSRQKGPAMSQETRDKQKALIAAKKAKLE